MSVPNAATDEGYEDLIAALIPTRYQGNAGSSATGAGIRRWIRLAGADTALVAFTGDFGIRQRPVAEQDREMFRGFVELWYTERIGAASSMAEIIACPSHLRIIGMGLRALPLIIEQLEREGNDPDHWCAALEAITGEDPVPEDAHGDTVRIAEAWIAWNRVRVAWSFPTSTT